MPKFMICACLTLLLVGCAGMNGSAGHWGDVSGPEGAAHDPHPAAFDSDADADGAPSGKSAEKPASSDSLDAMKSDKSGTNPINFSYDLRLYNEYRWLNTDGDGSQNLTTLEFRAPILDGKMQFRVKVPYAMLEADLDDDGSDDVDESGFGDINFRLLAVPLLDMKSKFAIAVGVEAFFDTASEGVLGSGTTSFGPQVFAVFFKPFGGFVDLISPAYQQKFSVDEDKGRSDINQSIVDVFALKMSEDKQRWLLVNPTFIWDHEAADQYLRVDVEMGTMLDRLLGTSGHSVYLRPGFVVGGERPDDYNIEVGYKIIW